MPRTSTNPENNSQNYSIFNADGFVESVAKFKYLGYFIEFSTVGYSSKNPDNKVVLYDYDNVHVENFHSVENAIEYVHKEQKRQYDLDSHY